VIVNPGVYYTFVLLCRESYTIKGGKMMLNGEIQYFNVNRYQFSGERFYVEKVIKRKII
jgi:hypothetical protein